MRVVSTLMTLGFLMSCAQDLDHTQIDGCDGRSCVFAPGEAGDPVLAMALEARTNVTVQLQIANQTGVTLEPGVVVFTELFQDGQPASAALRDFVDSALPSYLDTNALISALSLTPGVEAFSVESIAAGVQDAIAVDVPAGSEVYYIAGLGDDAFVGSSGAPIVDGGGNPSVIQVDVFSYSIDGTGTVQSGSTTLANPTGATLVVGNLEQCVVATGMPITVTLLDDNFSNGIGDTQWPLGYGYSGDFGGDWSHDGVTARYYNPNWGGADPGAPPLPTMTGLVRFFDLCPNPGSRLWVSYDINTVFTADESDTTMVVYFFDDTNGLLGVQTNFPTGGRNVGLAGVELDIPDGTRRVAVVPMAYFADGEMGTVFVGRLNVVYEPSWATERVISVNDGFEAIHSSEFGEGQPLDWQEFGGDWYTFNDAATLWNPTWGGDQSEPPPVDTGMVKAFSIDGAYEEGDMLDASVFVAATFVDPGSFVSLRLYFDDVDTTNVESRRLQGTAYGKLELRRIPIPAGASNLTVVINAYLGPDETSSLYADDLVVTQVHPLPYEEGQTSTVQATARPYGLGVVAPVRLLGTDLASYSFQTNDLPGLLELVDTQLGERQELEDVGGVSVDVTTLQLAEQASVRVYFLGEGAGYHNTLGFNSDGTVGIGANSTLIFPDASSGSSWLSPGSGSGSRQNTIPLQPGDFVDLGDFSSGTILDFFLVSNGARRGTNVFTSQPTLNPDGVEHVVAFALEDSPYLIIGFEDLYGGGDNDFNDVVIAIDIGAANIAALVTP